MTDHTKALLPHDSWAADVSALLVALREARELADGLELGVADDLDRIYQEAIRYARGIPNA